MSIRVDLQPRHSRKSYFYTFFPYRGLLYRCYGIWNVKRRSCCPFRVLACWLQGLLCWGLVLIYRCCRLVYGGARLGPSAGVGNSSAEVWIFPVDDWISYVFAGDTSVRARDGTFTARVSSIELSEPGLLDTSGVPDVVWE